MSSRVPRLPPGCPRPKEGWALFAEGARFVLSKWELLHTAVAEEWGGHASRAKFDHIVDDLLLNCEDQWREGHDLHLDTLDEYLVEVSAGTAASAAVRASVPRNRAGFKAAPASRLVRRARERRTGACRSSASGTAPLRAMARQSRVDWVVLYHARASNTLLRSLLPTTKHTPTFARPQCLEADFNMDFEDDTVVTQVRSARGEWRSVAVACPQTPQSRL